MIPCDWSHICKFELIREMMSFYLTTKTLSFDYMNFSVKIQCNSSNYIEILLN